MMKLIISFAIGLAAASGALAQTPVSKPPPSPPPSSTPQPPAGPSANIPLNRGRVIDPRASNFPLNPVSDSDRLSARVVRLQSIIGPLYRKPNSKDTAALAPDPALVQQYSSLLKSSGTGIVLLAPDSGCANSDRVVNVSDDCLKFQFPGAGNSFSFRTEAYRLRHLADITYVDGMLRITGIFMHGIAVDLGDVAIDSASVSTAGMQFLTSFEPSTTSDDVAVIDRNLTQGVNADGFLYSKEVKPSPGRTYGIRAVAYRGKVVRSAGGIRYNELDYDKRRDVTVVFRVLEISKDGVTLVWRKLADTEPPRIKIPKEDEKRADESEAN